MAGFGGTIKLQGEQAYRQALKAIAADLKNVAAEQKLTASTYDKTDTSLSALSKRSEDLKSKLSAQQAKWDTLSKAIKDYQSQQDKNKNTIQSVEAQLDKEKTKLEEVARQYGTNSREYQEQAKVVDNLEKELKDLNAQYDKNETTLKTTQAALTSTEADIKKTGSQMEKLAEQAKKAGDGTEDLGDSAKDAGKKAQDAAQGGFTVMKGVLADLASKVIQKAAEGLKTLARNIYDAGTNFDSAMSKVGAVSGATGDELDKLTQKAKEMGETTKFSASESAEAFNYMAMAGWKTEDMLNGIEGVLNLAAASGSDLATTSDIVTDALTAMGYAAGDAGRLADVMAAASSNANTNVEMMGHTFQYAAPIIGAMGYNMEDAAVAIGLMANAGIKADKAGTALRSILTRLAAPPKECASAMEALGISLTDSSGKMKTLDQVMVELRGAFSKLSETQQTQYAKSLAGAEAMSGLLAIVNSGETDFNKLTTAVAKSEGSAKKMADTMQNNVAGKMTILKSQIEGIYLTIWEKLEPAITRAIGNISKALKNVDWDKVGEKASKAFEKVVDVFTWLLENGDLVINAIKGVIAAFVVTKIVNFTTSIVSTVTELGKAVKAADGFAGAIGGIGKAISANPFGLLVGAITGVGVALGGMISNMIQASDTTSEFKKHLDEQTQTVNDNKNSWDELKKAQKDSLDADMTQIANIATLKDELTDLVDANGRVKEGYEGRAKFILGTLNEALGTEYTMTGNVIDKYGELQNSIDSLIEKKKAEAILNSQEALYIEAINKRAEAYQKLDEIKTDLAGRETVRENLLEDLAVVRANNENGRNQDEILRIQKLIDAHDAETNNIQSNYDKQLDLLDEYAYNIGTYEQNMALAHEGRYSEMSTATWDWVKDTQKAGDAQKAELEKESKNLQIQLEHQEKLYKDTGNEIYKTQADDTRKQLQVNQEKLKAYNSATESGLKLNSSNWTDNATQVLSELTGKKIEFRDAGDGQVEFYADGVKQGEAITKEKARQVAEAAVKELDKKTEAQGMGQNVVTGFTNGTGNQSLWSTAKSTARSFASSILSTMKKALQEKSPSRATREMGEFLLQGLSMGIKDEEKDTLAQAADFGEAVIDAMNGGLSGAVDTNAIQQLQNAMPDNLSASFRASMAGASAEAAQVEQRGIISAFKQALAEMKIEMDDYEMGKFVDKTVSRAIYS